MNGEQGLSHEWLTNAVLTKERENKLGKLISITRQPFDGKGESFTSDVERISIAFMNETGSKQRTIMVVAKVNKAVSKEGPDEDNQWNNRTEVEIYLNVLRQMEELMEEFIDHRETIWPDLYGHIPYSVLLLEDLGVHYRMIPRLSFFDEEHALLVLRELGRYHAMSKVLIERGQIGDNYRGAYLVGCENIFHEKFSEGTVQLLSKAMIDKSGSWKDVGSCETIGKRLEALSRTAYKRRVEIYKKFDERFEVLNHGDFRSSNMMTKTMEYTGHPYGVKFFDFQLPHINSFAWDLAYFFPTSIEPSVRRARRDQLHEAYQQSLADNLKFFGYEGYIPTIEDVKKETDRFAFIEFHYMIISLPFVISSLDKTMEIDKIATHPAEEAINPAIYGEKMFVDLITGDFEWAIKRNLF